MSRLIKNHGYTVTRKNAIASSSTQLICKVFTYNEKTFVSKNYCWKLVATCTYTRILRVWRNYLANYIRQRTVVELLHPCTAKGVSLKSSQIHRKFSLCVSVCLSVSQIISVCLTLSQFFSDRLSLSQIISVYLKLSQFVSDCLRLPQIVSDCLRLFQIVSGCIRLSQIVSDCLSLSQIFWDCLWLFPLFQIV